ETDVSRRKAAARRAEAARSLETLKRGDIIRVPGGRRAGMAVVLEPGPRGHGPNLAPASPAAGGCGGDRARMAAMAGQGPLVLTANRQVKRLSLADFPVPVEAVDRIKIPGSFSVRSPQHRRDLAASMRNRLAGREISGPRRAADWEAPPGGGQPPHQQEGASLPRRPPHHPSHGCPDREEHARYAERYTRLKRETEQLERKVASRSHVIARTFDRVGAVLEELGYLTGDTVTPEGRMLGGLYSELDLLAAECLRRGYWDGLDTQEMTACVSALSFESRQADDAARPRLPSSKVRDVLSRMVRTWGQLDELEKANGVSFLREPDLGFAATAYEWAGGARLDDVLADSDLTPGDFVRSVKQLVDLLDQIAAAPRAGPGRAHVAETARAAIAAIRRGVVAYTTVT